MPNIVFIDRQHRHRANNNGYSTYCDECAWKVKQRQDSNDPNGVAVIRRKNRQLQQIRVHLRCIALVLEVQRVTELEGSAMT